jgi:hypothetical protein
MKLKDITEWSEHWSTPIGTMDVLPTVADGVFVGPSLWGTSIINLVVDCAGGRYFDSIRAPAQVYDHVLEFLKRHQGRKLREVMDADIDISDGDSIVPWPSTYNAPVPSVMVIWESGFPCRRSMDGA